MVVIGQRRLEFALKRRVAGQGLVGRAGHAADVGQRDAARRGVVLGAGLAVGIAGPGDDQRAPGAGPVRGRRDGRRLHVGVAGADLDLVEVEVLGGVAAGGAGTDVKVADRVGAVQSGHVDVDHAVQPEFSLARPAPAHLQTDGDVAPAVNRNGRTEGVAGGVIQAEAPGVPNGHQHQDRAVAGELAPQIDVAVDGHAGRHIEPQADRNLVGGGEIAGANVTGGPRRHEALQPVGLAVGTEDLRKPGGRRLAQRRARRGRGELAERGHFEVDVLQQRHDSPQKEFTTETAYSAVAAAPAAKAGQRHREEDQPPRHKDMNPAIERSRIREFRGLFALSVPRAAAEAAMACSRRRL